MRLLRYTWALAVLVPAAAGCDRGQPGRVEPAAEPVDVTVSGVARAAASRRVPARIVAARTAELATRISGVVRGIEVDVGDAVAPGAPLVRLDESDVAAGIEAAEARVTAARRHFERIRALEADGAATGQELDEARARLATAEAGLRQARGNLDYVTLRAPFPGVITARMADPGDLAVPGHPVLVLAAAGATKVEADLPADLVGTVSAGDPVRAVRPDDGRAWGGTVRRVVPVVELSSHRFRLEAELTGGEPGPTAGTYAQLEIPVPGGATRWIPADAVVRRGQLAGAWTLEGEAVRLRWLRLGRRVDDAVEVLAGLDVDALVVREPPETLADGTAVGTVERRTWRPPAVAGGGEAR